MSYFWLLSTFLFTVTSSLCPVWNCTSLSFDACVQVSSNQLLVNSKGCDRDFYCSYDDVMNWFLPLSLPSNAVFNCTRQVFSPDSGIQNGTVFCGNRNSEDELAIGSHPKACLTDQDCVTVGGWTTDCICGMNGLFYCQPGQGSNAMDSYWNLCAAALNKTNDPRVTATQKVYWDYYQKYYPQIVSAPICVLTMLNEFLTLSALKTASENRGKVAFLTVLFASFLY